MAAAPVPARRRALVASAALAVLATGCIAPVPLDAPPVAELPPPVPDWITIRATEADDLRRVALAVGASFAVSLRVPAEAGQGWIVVGQPDGLELTGRWSGPVWPPGAPANPALPPPLWQVFVFEARRAVDGPLVLELRGAETAARPRRVSLFLTPAR
ncbi:MAG: hypothetical protein WCK28_12990 [Burkholderiales bacterium]